MTLLSRILGFVRDMVIASVFGATGETDAFFVAFKIPNFLRRLFAEGAFSQAFVPRLAEILETDGFEAARRFLKRLTGGFGLVLVAITLIGIALSPLWVTLFAPGFRAHPEQLDLASELLRWAFPYLFLISLAALAGGILNTLGQFAIPAMTPLLLNLSFIGLALGLSPHLDRPILALGYAVLLGGLLQLGFQLPALARRKLLAWPRIDLTDQNVREVARRMGPSLMSASVSQLNLLINTLLASLLPIGSISWLYYSDRLLEFPLGLLGVALGTVLLPELSRRVASDNPNAYNQILDWALRWQLVMGLPASLGLMLLSHPLMLTLFQFDRFSPLDAEMASRSLMAYALGLMGFLTVKVLVPAFSARGDLSRPARFGVYSVALNLGLSVFFALGLAPKGWAHAGLALAVSLAAFLNAGLLLISLIRAGHFRPSGALYRFGGRVLIGNGLMALAIRYAQSAIDFVGLSHSERMLALSALIGVGLVTYSASLLLMGLRWHHLVFSFHSPDRDATDPRS